MNEVIEDTVHRQAWKISGGLKVADKATQWYEALLVSDCNSLMKQLQETPSLVVQTGHKGSTVLHAAARRGCTPLVNQVMLLFKDYRGQFITSKDRAKVLQSPLHDLFQVEDFKTKLRAVEIMECFMGSDVIRRHMDNFYENKFSRSFRHFVGALTGRDAEGRKTTLVDVDNGDAESNRTLRNTCQWQSLSIHHARAPISIKTNHVEDGSHLGINIADFKSSGETRMANDVALNKDNYLVRTRDENNKRTVIKSVSFNDYSSVSPTPASTNDQVDVNLLKAIHHIIDNLSKEEKFHQLMEKYLENKDYNFDKTRKELIFHYACQSMGWKVSSIGTGSAEDFLLSFMKEWKTLAEKEANPMSQGSHGDKILLCLYQIKNWQGMTPCHAALGGSALGLERLLDLLRKTNDPSTINMFLNACDARGWTPLHKAVAMVGGHDCYLHRRVVHLLLKGEVNVNAKLPISHATPLHLAILYNLPRVVESLIWSPNDIDGVINACLKRNIRFSNTDRPRRQSSRWWSPLQLATAMGQPCVVEVLFTKIEMIYEVSKLKNKGVIPKNYDENIPAIHLAVASGIPEVLQLFLNMKQHMFDPTKTTKHKRTTLHFAVDTTAPYMVDKPIVKANNFMNSFQCILDFGDAHHLEYIIIKALKTKAVFEGHIAKGYTNKSEVGEGQVSQNNKPQLTTLEEYGGKQACITMLLQNGVDIWQRDDQRKFAELGPETSNELRLWWFEKIASETSTTKRTLNDAANAISVVAALIATASYAGPLQPPLGFGSVTTSSYFDLVQTSSLLVRIFVVSNCLSFYLAIGSIMVAIVPSMAQLQGIGFEEWQRSRRNVGVALNLLLVSVFCVLVSFAAASNAGIPDNKSSNHMGLAFYSAMLGGISCLIGMSAFFMVFLRYIMSFGISIGNAFASNVGHIGKGPRQNKFAFNVNLKQNFKYPSS